MYVYIIYSTICMIVLNVFFYKVVHWRVLWPFLLTVAWLSIQSQDWALLLQVKKKTAGQKKKKAASFTKNKTGKKKTNEPKRWGSCISTTTTNQHCPNNNKKKKFFPWWVHLCCLTRALGLALSSYRLYLSLLQRPSVVSSPWMW